MKKINQVLAVAAAVSLSGITGCGADSGPSPSVTASAPPVSAPSASAASATGEASIMIKDFKFQVPASVKPGAMVTVTNSDSAPHTLTAKDKGGFDVQVPAGATVTFTAPDTPGEYALICTFHPQMSGTLVVK